MILKMTSRNRLVIFLSIHKEVFGLLKTHKNIVYLQVNRVSDPLLNFASTKATDCYC